MVPPTEQGEIRQRRRPTASPVSDVMALADTHSAAWEAAAVVAML
jgi:hypothetical protein